MNTINEYINDKSKVGINDDPFNEIDNLVFSVLSYTELKDIGNIEEQLIPIKDVSDIFYSKYSGNQIDEKNTYNGPAPVILKPLSESPRFNNIEIGYYEEELDASEVIQFSAMTVVWENIAYIAFRGTDESIIGWQEDFHMSYKTGVSSQLKAVKYLNRVAEKLNKNIHIHIGGHSKGGNLAIYAAAFCDENIKKRIVKIWGNDSPGFHSDVTECHEFKEIVKYINLIVPESSVVGMLMDNVVKPKIVKSSERFLMQHDAFSWIIEGNRFVEVEEISGFAKFINQSIKNWMKDVKLEEREEVGNIIFHCIREAEISTLVEIKEGGFSAIKSILKVAKNLPTVKRKKLDKFFGGLISSGGSLLMQNIKNNTKGSDD